VKNKNAKLIYSLLFYPAAVLFLVRMGLERYGYEKAAYVINAIFWAFIIGALITRVADRFFPSWFRPKGETGIDNNQTHGV
jgi:hypothetical protein